MTGQLSKENINKHQKIKDMNKQTIITALIAVLLGLVSCSSDNDYEDKVEQVTIYVSAETGMFYNVPNTTLEEGMMIRVDGEDHYICVAFNTIAGFTYEKGNEYELLVKKTKLANPPKDSGSIRYELIRIVSKKKVMAE
jgi:hypothetical protein